MADVDVSSIAPDAMDKTDAEQKDHIWRFLVYGNPGTGKTHFGFSMAESDRVGPVLCIDTEQKAHSIAEKFDGEIYIWSVESYTEAADALDDVLAVAREYRSQAGERAVIMVDSMSHLWDWSQQRYKEMAHPGTDPQSVNLTSALEGGDSDWQAIKRLHNERFRDRIVNSPYHSVWTATSREDYGAILEGQEDPPAKPEGEKNNIYKATEVLHMFEGEQGVPTANLKKTAPTKWKFGMLEWPEFDAVAEIIESIVNAERSPEQVTLGEIRSSFEPDVTLHDGDPDLALRGDTNE